MKVSFVVFCGLLASLLFFPGRIYAQSTLLLPVPPEDSLSPQLSIVTPTKDAVVSSKVTLEMQVNRFDLTAKPVESQSAGVIAIYVDGKFFTNTASTSATLTIPRAGTHHIVAELTHVDRSPVVPRVSDSLYIHVQKKTPYLAVSNLRAESILYTEKPSFQIDYQRASFEDTSSYYTVFIDGEVDGTSKESEDGATYTLTKPLSEGKHSLRLALYTENGRPYFPTVEYQVPFVYSAHAPQITEITLNKSAVPSEPLSFDVTTSDFEIGKDGYLQVTAEGTASYFTEPHGALKGVSAGNQKITFALLDRNGYALQPGVSEQKVVTVSAPAPDSGSLSQVFQKGSFFVAGEGEPRWGYLVLGLIEAVAILVFGVLLLQHERKRDR